MDPQTARRIAEALESEAHVSEGIRRRFDSAAELLPEPDAWATATVGGAVMLVLLAGEVLFTVRREAHDGEERLVVTSRPARLTEVRHRRDDGATRWHFELRHGDSVEIEGRINPPARPGEPETFDRAESLARALAERAGWRADRVPAHGRESPRDEPPVESAAQPSETSRQQVTDLWGNPIRRGRRP